jgi:hypothetical protein
MEKFIPARPGIDVGLCFNTMNGEVRGLAVGGNIREATVSCRGELYGQSESINGLPESVPAPAGRFRHELEFTSEEKSSVASNCRYGGSVARNHRRRQFVPRTQSLFPIPVRGNA